MNELPKDAELTLVELEGVSGGFGTNEIFIVVNRLNELGVTEKVKEIISTISKSAAYEYLKGLCDSILSKYEVYIKAAIAML